jgi:hypothetical protein
MADERFKDLTPMQRWASEVALTKAPTLYIVEDSTGGRSWWFRWVGHGRSRKIGTQQRLNARELFTRPAYTLIWMVVAALLAVAR